MTVDFDRYSLRIDGERKFIRAASLPYFRLPGVALWEDRVEKLRGAGFDAVEVRYPWSYHSDARGAYDFTAERDVDQLHRIIADAGMYLVARPGPYIASDLDLGGLPAWLLRERARLRCRDGSAYTYSVEFMDCVAEWFGQVLPRIAACEALVLVEVEHQYTTPTPLSGIPWGLQDFVVRHFGASALRRLLRTRGPLRRRRRPAQSIRYVRELVDLARGHDIQVPILHADLDACSGRQVAAPLPALERRSDADLTQALERQRVYAAFAGDERALDALCLDAPQVYAGLDLGLGDAWGGVGFDEIRAKLAPDHALGLVVAALAERATVLCWNRVCGGTNWGYMASPAGYSSYDCGSPIDEAGRPGASYELLRRLNAWLDDYAEDLCATDRVAGPKEVGQLARRSSQHGHFDFLESTSGASPSAVPRIDSGDRAAGGAQIRAFGADGALRSTIAAGSAPEWTASRPSAPAVVPTLDRFRFSAASPHLDASFDDSGWMELDPRAVALGRIDIDSLGLHYGFVWYRGTFSGALDRLVLDARHCYSVWINRQLVAAGDVLANTLGVGPDGASPRSVSLRGVHFGEGRNALVILVESLGHNEGFADDGNNPRGLVRIDTGCTRVRWTARGGLVRGERGLAPVVAFDAVERVNTTEIALPHTWAGEPAGVGLYETEFELAGVDPKETQLSLSIDGGAGKANIYVNGYLLGRYWPEMGPQTRFVLPWGVLRASGANQLAIALWKRSEPASLGTVRLVA